MKLDFTNFLYALSYALDAAEREVTGSRAEHGKRVSLISHLCGKGLSLAEEERVNLVACAILHDNAIAEYLREEYDIADGTIEDKHEEERRKYGTPALHTIIGERRIRTLPLRGNVENVILWHHENADGSGLMGLKEEETNLFSQIIHLVDTLDIRYDFMSLSDTEFCTMQKYVRAESGKTFSRESSRLFLENVRWEDICRLQKIGPLEMLKSEVPVLEQEYTDSEITRIAAFFAGIVDFKSSFTKDHSVGVAKKAETMARFYEFPHEKLLRFAFAGALHDIGKMSVGNSILEKPDKLDASEFGQMKDHAAETYKILSTIQGFEDITEWAANHHEKLDGTGYSRRLTAEQMTFEDRLMACIDIYQALTESRPYKDGLSHKRSIKIMREMAAEGKIDARIVEDMDQVFGKDAPEEEEPAEVRLTTREWKCQVCGYIYEGDSPPASCPICDSDMDAFKML